MLVDRLLRMGLRILLFIFGRCKITGQENLLPTGPYMIAVNHMSKADPPLLFYAIPYKMRFFAGEKWERHLVFGPILRWGGAIYIRRGEVDRKALREALQALKDKSIFGLAPEGTRSRVGALIPARDGAAYLATRAMVPVVPVGLVNTDILGHNMARLRRTDLQLHIGKPFAMPDIGRRPRSTDLAAYTHLIMVNIAALLPERYWGSYADSLALRALLANEDPWPYCLAAEGVVLEA